MARTASGHQFLDKAKELLANARTVQELRQAQSVILPLEFSMSLTQTSSILQRCPVSSLHVAILDFLV